MIRLASLSAAAAITVLTLAPVAPGAIIAIEPFEGDGTETFESAPFGFHASLGIFESPPTFEAGGDPNAFMEPAFITSFSSFMGSTIFAHTGGAFAHMTGPVEFVFPTAVQQFGGFMATNGGADGGLVEFFDAGDQLIGTAPLDVTFQTGSAPYTWNGWSSDEAFSRVRISSNGELEGFLGFDDLEFAFVPAPGAAMLLVVGLVGVGRKRRKAETPKRRNPRPPAR